MPKQTQDVESTTSLVSSQPTTTPPSSSHDPLLARLSARCMDRRRGLALASFVTLVILIIAISNSDSTSVSLSPQTQNSQDASSSAEPIGDHEEATLFSQLFDGGEGDDFEGIGPHVDCNKTRFDTLVPGTWQYEVLAADCGAGYDFHAAAGQKHLKVVLYGDDFRKLVGLSGCPDGGHLQCPWSPGCQFSLGNRPSRIKDADVVVVNTGAHAQIKDAVRKKDFFDDNDPGQFRVLYYREAFWPSVAVSTQKSEFEFEMGIHFHAGIVNPLYLRRPRTLLGNNIFPFVPFERRPHFAMSIISDCHASSQRQIYIDHLSDYLGQHRVHQYGECGNRKLPPPPISHAIKTISQYKFYLSFENTIQDGYVTEKLMTVLNMGGIIPIYYGAPDAPNITITPSYINVLHFHSPKELAQYLLFLEKNPDEYNKYNIWRSSGKYFHPDYLRLIQRQMPGQEEMLKYRQRGFPKFSRRAQCCRLCDLSFVRAAAAGRKSTDMPRTKWHEDQINHHVFGGLMNKRPGNKARLDE